MVQSSILQRSETETEALIREKSRQVWIDYGHPNGCDRLIWAHATSLIASEDELGQTLSALRYRLATGQEQQLYDRLFASPYQNIAEGKPATMSSRSVWSVGTLEEDASRATTAEAGPGWSFHTAFEPTPWWRVDLGDRFTIERIRLFNRVDIFDATLRFKRFAIETSDDDLNWTQVFEKDDDIPVGGVLGYPFIWTADCPVLARYVRLRLNADTSMALNRIEIYGF